MHSSRMRTARSSSRPGGLHQAPPGSRLPPDQAPPWDQAPPPVDRHTPVNILLCPKLRLRAVMRRFYQMELGIIQHVSKVS